MKFTVAAVLAFAGVAFAYPTVEHDGTWWDEVLC